MIWGYRRGRDEIEAELFEGDKLPPGWADSPASVDEKPKRGRPRKNNADNQ